MNWRLWQQAPKEGEPCSPGGTGGTPGSKREQQRGGGEQRPGVSRDRGGDQKGPVAGRVKAENLQACEEVY